MIIDLPRFVRAEKPYWDELQTVPAATEAEPPRRMSLAKIQRLLALRNHGVRIAVVSPERIRCEVAAGYLEVKRGQVL